MGIQLKEGCPPFNNTVTKRLYIANDHGGVAYKAALMTWLKNSGLGVECVDLGVNDSKSVDYPIFSDKVCDALKDDADALGVLICRTGIGMSMAANRREYIRAAVCSGGVEAHHTRADNNANILCLGADTVAMAGAIDALYQFLTTPFEGGRHARRVNLFSGNKE